MEKQTFGNIITKLRKENGMTQPELAKKIGVSDKAISKWERDLSLPDVNTISKLAEIFHISVDELMQVKINKKENMFYRYHELIDIILKGIALAMGIGVVVLALINC